MGYFYGFKLHLVVNDQGEILAFCLTPGNTDDRKPLPILARELWAQVIETLRGWLAANRPDSAAPFTPEEIRPLVLLSETDTPAAAEAALLLALLYSGRWVDGNESPADRE
jgi:hypothetical protein